MQKLRISAFLMPLLIGMTLSGCSDNSESSNNNGSNSNTNQSQNNTQNAIYSEGVHYKKLSNPIIHSSRDIIVTEFFWYGCSHCAHFEPFIHQWEANKPAGVILEQSPAIWSDAMKLHAKVFFIAQTLEGADKIHAQLFNEVMALHQQKDLTKHKAALASVLSQHGLPKEEFYQQLDSFKIKGLEAKAAKLMKQAEVKGTPMLVVGGIYAIINSSVKSADELLTIANFLIKKIRLSEKH